MLSQVFWFLVFAVPVLLAGGLVSWRVLSLRAARARAALERDMTARVRERYQAYLDLESQIRRAIEQFDRCEADFQRRLAAHSAQIEELESAVVQHAGEDRAPHASAPPAEDSDWLGLGGDAARVEVPANGRGPSPEIAEWEARLASLQEEKKLEMERQSMLVAELTGRLERLEPITEATRRLEQELEEWRERYRRLEEQSAGEIAALRERAEHAECLANEARERERALAELQAGGGSDASLGETRWRGEVSLLRARMAELAPYAERANDAERRLRDAEARCREIDEARVSEAAERAREIAELVSKLQLAAETELRAEEWHVRCSEVESRKDLELRTVEARLSEVQRSCAAKDESLDGLERAREALESDLRACQDELKGARGELAAQASELQSLGCEQASQSQALRERDERLARLSERSEALEAELRRARESCEGQGARISELMRAVDLAQEDAHAQKAAALEQASVVDTAESMLAELRPKLEALERELTRRGRR